MIMTTSLRSFRSALPRHSVALALLGIAVSTAVSAEPQTGSLRIAEHQQWLARATQPTGLLIPLYSYPAHVHQNETFNRLIALKRKYPTVPCCVIVNPASGPGEAVDENYRKAIDRLYGAGCYLAGYVSTEYGDRDAAAVTVDLERWHTLYPRAGDFS